MKAHPHAEVIKAWADGIPCQYRTDNSESWKTLDFPNESRTPAFHKEWQYRIKPKTVRYRVALLKDDARHWTCTADNAEQEKEFEDCQDFIKWLTDWIEVEV